MTSLEEIGHRLTGAMAKIVWLHGSLRLNADPGSLR